ncbi:TPM domain-containing protein, partial [Acinetobacter baumannii]|nr:TPM domain-containing protein [Acinetobacter baumannii]
MVTTSETTQIITQPKIEEYVEPSLKRWFKHFCYLPASSKYFSKQDKQAIAEAVQQAEHGHVGEIQVVIEGHIPCSQAYRQNTRLRAQQLFAELGVWDTELNSGVLLYLNLCERTV